MRYPVSDHCDGELFFNPGMDIKKGFRHVFKMYRERIGKPKWPVFVENTATPILAENLPLEKTHITYINHASHLIQLQNCNILLDPVFSKSTGPSFLGPKRVRNPGIDLHHLPPIHFVLISHNHYDHMDLKSLNHLNKLFNPLFIVPLGNQKYLSSQKISNVIELDWWQTHKYNTQQSISLVPAQHWSMRKINDANKALWGGFWITSGALKIYYSGDTGYGPHFKMLHQNLGAPHVSILPIGAYEPRWFMKPQHMNPEEAVLASLDLHSKLSIATHHQTFRLSNEGYYDPVFDLKHGLRTHGVSENKFLTPENGETVIFSID